MSNDAEDELPNLNHVFVYGTLKRGQCRERCWPVSPVVIHPAWTFGKLVDLGPYPALLPGPDRVLGELWSFREEDFGRVIHVLDKVEVTNQPGIPNEYDRVLVDVALLKSGRNLVASTYRFADAVQASRYKALVATADFDAQHYVVWP